MRSVLAIWLVRKDGSVCACILSRAQDLAKKQPPKTTATLQFAFLFVVDIKKIQFSAAIGKRLREAGQEAAHDRRSKGIEEKDEARTGRKSKFRRFAAADDCGRLGSAKCSPSGEIAPCNTREFGMQLYPDHTAKMHLRSQQHRTPHARADINKGCLLQRRRQSNTAPPID